MRKVFDSFYVMLYKKEYDIIIDYEIWYNYMFVGIGIYYILGLRLIL